MANMVIKAMVEGGKATGGPPLGPALGPAGVNINDVIAEINNLTKDFAGVKVPVSVIVDKGSKKFKIEIGTPPTSELIKKEAKVEVGRKEKDQIAGNVTMEQIIKVSNMKSSSTLATSKKQHVKSIVGTCVSLGITVESKQAKEIIREIDEGKYDSLFR